MAGYSTTKRSKRYELIQTLHVVSRKHFLIFFRNSKLFTSELIENLERKDSLVLVVGVCHE